MTDTTKEARDFGLPFARGELSPGHQAFLGLDEDPLTKQAMAVTQGRKDPRDIGLSERPMSWYMEFPPTDRAALEGMFQEVRDDLRDQGLACVKAAKLHVPENWEEIKNLSTRDFKVYAGANDWESVWSACAFLFHSSHLDSYTQRVWAHFKLDEDQSRGGGYDEEWGRKVVRAWLRLANEHRAARAKAVDLDKVSWSPEDFTETAKDVPEIKEHGIERLQWVDKQAAAKYSPPYNAQKIRELGLAHLLDDPAHRWRADQGIELIHQEPTLEELQRIMANWEVMTPEQQQVSDTQSVQFFGLSNRDHYKKLLSGYAQKAASAATLQGPDPVLAQHDTPDPQPFPTSGPEALAFALQNLDLDQKEKEAHAAIKKGLKTKRPDAIKTLGFIQGLRRANLRPHDLMLTRVPVIPPVFRPYTLAGEVFVPGDANELYRDLINIRDVHAQLEQKLGPEAAAENRLRVYDAVQALYGYGEPTSPKTRERGVSGFLKKLTGVSPKWSFPQAKMLAKPVDFTGRGVVGVDPDLGLDEIGLPEEQAWKMYANYVQRRLVRSGMAPTEAIRHLRERSPLALKHLDLEMGERPVVYSRSPAWHKFNVIGGWAKRIPGDTIMVNPLITTCLYYD